MIFLVANPVLYATVSKQSPPSAVILFPLKLLTLNSQSLLPFAKDDLRQNYLNGFVNTFLSVYFDAF